jgi:hypothetical protein
MVAHGCAKQVSKENRVEEWHVPPPALANLLAKDCGVVCLPSWLATAIPDFPKKTKCISYVRQDQVYIHMIDVMSEISENSNKNVQELNHCIISLLHSNVRLEGL